MSNKLDLRSISDQLPPNTGPPGTTPTNSNTNNGSKNLSHVPCKFFKQGICQAGNSCPFSHNMDNSTAGKLPCKYFQKGNCKFGSKCALAHILPDGTKVNYKSFKTPQESPKNPERIHLFSNSYSSVFSSAPYSTKSYLNNSPPLFSETFEDDEDSADNSIFEEDYLPNSLTDIILTPQEVERRDSRSQSGTLSVRPTFKKEKISSDVFLMD